MDSLSSHDFFQQELPFFSSSRPTHRRGSPHPRVTLTCDFCGNTFTCPPSNRTSHHSFCNKACWYAWHSKGEGVERVCEQCGQTFTILRRQANYTRKTVGRFCSQQCKLQWQKGQHHPYYKGGQVERTCEACGKIFSAYPSDIRCSGAKFCSNPCRYGEHHQWYRHGKGYKGYTTNFPSIATAIRKRDGLRCMLCHQSHAEDGKRLRLHVHHIDHDRQNNAPNNLITLCQVCHASETFCKPAEREAWQERLSNLLYQTYGGAM